MAQTQYLDKAGLEVLVSNIKAADKKITDKIGEVPAKVGETTTSTVVSYVNAKAAEAATANSALADRVTSAETAITTLTGTEAVEGSVAKAVKDEADRAKAVEKANADNITALQGLVGSTSVASQITSAIAEATGENSQLAKDVAANATAIETLNGGAAVEGSVAKAISDLRKEIMEGEGVDNDVVDSFKELQEYIEEHGKEAADMASSITDLETVVGTPKKGEEAATGLYKEIDDLKAGTVANATHAVNSDAATKATQDGDGNIISTTYIKVADITSVSEEEINALFA